MKRKYKYYCLVGNFADCYFGTCKERRYINYFYYLWLKFNRYSTGKELINE